LTVRKKWNINTEDYPAGSHQDFKFKEKKASSQTRHARLFVEFPRTRGMLVTGNYLHLPWFVIDVV